MTPAGRRRDVDRIARIGAAVHESSLFFSGDVGIGKTRLLEAAEAESSIESVLLRINPAESAWPLSGFSAILSSIDDSRAIEFGGRFVLRSSNPEHMFAAARDLLTLIRGLALPPMLLLVDDIDQMDSESQVLAGFVAGRLGGTGIRLIATVGSFDPAGPFGGLPHEKLGPLDSAAALELMTALASPPLAEGSLAIIASQSDGNPRALTENLYALDSDRAGHPLLLPMPPGRTATEQARRVTEGLSRAQRLMLERLSAAPLNLAAVATANGASDEDALQDLVFAGLVETRGRYVIVRSALLRAQLYWSLSGKARREHHAAAAQTYLGVDDRLELWHRASDAKDATSAGAMMAAAIALAREGYVIAAVEFAESARRRAGSPRPLLDLLADLAEAFFLQGELTLAARYLEAGLSVGTSSTLALRFASIRLRVEFMRTQRVPDPDFATLAQTHSQDHPRICAEYLTVAGLCLALRWEAEAAGTVLDTAATMMPAASRSALGLIDETRNLVEATEGRAANRSAVAFLPRRRVVDTIIAGRAAGLREEYSKARQLLSSVPGKRPSPEPIWVEVARYLLADNEVRAGRFPAAKQAISEWRTTTTGRPRGYLDAWLLYAEGGVAQAQEVVAERLATASHEENPAAAASLLALMGELHLIEGDSDEAARVLAHAELLGSRFGNPALVRQSADHIEALVTAGNIAGAVVVLREFEGRAAASPSRWAELALARSRGLVAEGDAALDIFGEAIGACRPTDSRLEVGRVHLAHAAKLESLGMRADARGALFAARFALDSAGATPWIQRLDALLGPSNDAGQSHLLLYLNEEEAQIARLVRQGMRNKEIAARLYISVRTVELRLTHIYRKVGARSRSHLVSLMS